MYRGEIFAYPLYLQEKLSSRQVTFFCMDVTCKYWPYLQRVIKSCPELQHLLNMKPFLSVFHAKAHDFKCEVSKHSCVIDSLSIPAHERLQLLYIVFIFNQVKWSGAYQEGAGLTLGEEVEQCNAFLSRIAVTTKHMSKAGEITTYCTSWIINIISKGNNDNIIFSVFAGRTDMLTLMAMRWNQQKFENLTTALTRRYHKVMISVMCFYSFTIHC